jgi:threonine dehydrogenase-like Zn-dependent dehydrogenase
LQCALHGETPIPRAPTCIFSREQYPVDAGRTIGHEPVGVIADIGSPTLCLGGKERMRRLMNVVRSGRGKLESMVTHRFELDQLEEASELFANQRDGVLKVAITP